MRFDRLLIFICAAALQGSVEAFQATPAVNLAFYIPQQRVAAHASRHAAVRSDYTVVQDKALVPRGGLVWPHVHAASMLCTAVVEFFMRLGNGRSPAQQDVIAPAAPPSRDTEPIFFHGSLCEHVVDAENGHEFWVCSQGVEHDEFSCRRAAKDGRWAYYVVRR